MLIRKNHRPVLACTHDLVHDLCFDKTDINLLFSNGPLLGHQ